MVAVNGNVHRAPDHEILIPRSIPPNPEIFPVTFTMELRPIPGGSTCDREFRPKVRLLTLQCSQPRLRQLGSRQAFSEEF